jgi:hypothetical protein
MFVPFPDRGVIWTPWWHQLSIQFFNLILWNFNVNPAFLLDIIN